MLKLFVSIYARLFESFILEHGNFRVFLKDHIKTMIKCISCACIREIRGARCFDIYSILLMNWKHSFLPFSIRYFSLTLPHSFIFIVSLRAFISMSISIIVEQLVFWACYCWLNTTEMYIHAIIIWKNGFSSTLLPPRGNSS